MDRVALLSHIVPGPRRDETRHKLLCLWANTFFRSLENDKQIPGGETLKISFVSFLTHCHHRLVMGSKVRMSETNRDETIKSGVKRL